MSLSLALESAEQQKQGLQRDNIQLQHQVTSKVNHLVSHLKERLWNQAQRELGMHQVTEEELKSRIGERFHDQIESLKSEILSLRNGIEQKTIENKMMTMDHVKELARCTEEKVYSSF